MSFCFLRHHSFLVALLLTASSMASAMDKCPEGSIARKVQLLWPSKGLMQTFDCAKEARREYIRLLNEHGHAEAGAMIPDGGKVPHIVQYQEFDSAGVLRSTKKFSLEGQLLRLEQFSDSGVLITRYRQDSQRVEEFSAYTPGEKIRECYQPEAGKLIDVHKFMASKLESSETEAAGVRLLEIHELSSSTGPSEKVDKKLLFKSAELAPRLTGQVVLKEEVAGIERCFSPLSDKKIFGLFIWGTKYIMIPRDQAVDLSYVIPLVKSPRSEDGKSFLERFERPDLKPQE